MNSKLTLILSLIVAAFFGPFFAAADDEKQSVYQFVVSPADLTIDEAVAALENRAPKHGFNVLASIEAGVPEDCSYRAHVLLLYKEDYGLRLMEANSQTAPFALVDRVNVFEDENGVHVSIVNPRSINRTVLMDDPTYAGLTGSHTADLRSFIAACVPGTPSEKQYGQERKKGYIGRTMGVMAGGKFADKIQTKAEVAGGELQQIAEKIRSALNMPGTEWGMHLVYSLPLPEYDLVVLGVSGTPMDSKSFSIVRAGSDKSRKRLSCPGLAHAGAYPMSVVIAKEGDAIRVKLIDTMYRMKMYFEDAGKWAFMKNMGMPGSIEDEIVQMINKGLQEEGLSTLQ